MTTSIKLADFSLKKFKSFRGMDGAGFNADIMLKGQKIAFASDSGSGGETTIEWVDSPRFESPAKIKEFLAGEEAMAMSTKRESAFRAEYPELYVKEPMPTSWCPADFVEYLVEKHMFETDVKKYAKKNGFVFAPKSDELFPKKLHCFPKPKGFKWTKKTLEEDIAHAKKLEKEIIILATPEIPV